MLEALLLVFCVSLVSLLGSIPLAYKLQWVDKPSDRKQHEGTPPLVGGLSIVLGCFAGLLYLMPVDGFVWPIMLASMAVFAMGLVDDVVDLPVKVRVLFILAVSAILIFMLHYFLRYMGDLLLLGNISLSWFGVPFTMIAVLGVANGFNMLDGIDGLAGGLAITSLLGVLAFAVLNGVPFINTMFLWVLLFAIAPYWLVNLKVLPVDKVFLGDSGAMFLGFFITWTLIVLSQVSMEMIQSNVAVGGAYIWLSPENALWCAALPIMDTVYCMYRRKRAGKSFFAPDRGHVHHVLMARGFSSNKTLWALLCASVALIVFGLIWERLMGKGAFFAFFILYFIYTQFMKNAIAKMKNV